MSPWLWVSQGKGNPGPEQEPHGRLAPKLPPSHFPPGCTIDPQARSKPDPLDSLESRRSYRQTHGRTFRKLPGDRKTYRQLKEGLEP